MPSLAGWVVSRWVGKPLTRRECGTWGFAHRGAWITDARISECGWDVTPEYYGMTAVQVGRLAKLNAEVTR